VCVTRVSRCVLPLRERPGTLTWCFERASLDRKGKKKKSIFGISSFWEKYLEPFSHAPNEHTHTQPNIFIWKHRVSDERYILVSSTTPLQTAREVASGLFTPSTHIVLVRICFLEEALFPSFSEAVGLE
jgi:hypothetical protein